ncbi:MAG: hypothetical protein KY456_13780 [Chloroflexi bacterium]|nr:hypothetical protein [Chloroflexota bacterium]
METARVMAEIRRLGYVVMLAMGMALVTAAPALAEVALSPVAPVCGTDQPESSDPWAAPPERGRPGEAY